MTQSIDSTTVRDANCGHCSVHAYASGQIEQLTLRALLAASAFNLPGARNEPQVVAWR